MSKGKATPAGTARAIIAPLRAALGRTAKVAGSLRRFQPEVHDADIVVAEPVDMNAVRAVPDLVVVEAGQEKIRVRVAGFQADIVVTDPEHHGAAMLYLTGPRELNLAMRARAKAAGLTLNQRGLWRGDELVAAATEKEIFAAMQLEWVMPMHRGDAQLRSTRVDWSEQVQGSAKDPYVVAACEGEYSCSCRGFSFHEYAAPDGTRRKWCKHIDEALMRRGISNQMAERTLVKRRRKRKKATKKEAA